MSGSKTSACKGETIKNAENREDLDAIPAEW